jgi:FkbM family methyltransferase
VEHHFPDWIATLRCLLSDDRETIRSMSMLRRRDSGLIPQEYELAAPNGRGTSMNNLISTSKHMDMIYDVGMHRGQDTDFYLRKGFRVVAYEANPDLVSFCRDRFRSYIDQKQLTIIEGAIIDQENMETGQMKVGFYKNEDDSTWGTVCPNWAERNERLNTSSSVIEVDTVNFSDMIVKYGMPYYMKIDIEGADLVCVNILKAFRERPDYISIESDKTSFKRIKQEFDLLSGLGYDRFQAVEQSSIPSSQSPPYTPREGKYVAHCFERGSSGLFGAELNDEWKSKSEILYLYRFIRLGYLLLGDDGIMTKWQFRGAWQLQSIIKRFLKRFTRAAVPGWYDTHARHVSADVEYSQNPRLRIDELGYERRFAFSRRLASLIPSKWGICR